MELVSEHVKTYFVAYRVMKDAEHPLIASLRYKRVFRKRFAYAFPDPLDRAIQEALLTAFPSTYPSSTGVELDEERGMKGLRRRTGGTAYPFTILLKQEGKDDTPLAFSLWTNLTPEALASAELAASVTGTYAGPDLVQELQTLFPL